MQVEHTHLEDVKIVTPPRHADVRGYFCEAFNAQAFADAGLPTGWVQENLSLSAVPGTLRGLHCQASPRAQDKLVSGLRGAILDVAVEVRVALDAGHHVVTCDALTYAGSLDNLTNLPSAARHTFVHGDIRDAGTVATTLARHRPDTILHLAAETHVDRSIDGPAAFVDTNITGTAVLLDAARSYWAGRGRLPDFRFLHVSTDYVFDGRGDTAFRPPGSPAPLGAYGRSKLAGEHAVRAANGPHVILRTSWVFSEHGRNFVRTMLRLGQTQDALGVIDDQIGGPTPATDIAQACMKIAAALICDPGKSGTYHFAGTPDVSWAGFAHEVFDQAGLDVAVTPIRSVDYPTPVQRPANSRLCCTGIATTLGIARPDWRAGLVTVLTKTGEVAHE
nr:sugar nucleotide-binding protein [Aliiroseovarius subalbicans]